MLKHRIVPVLLWDGNQCVKPISFQRPYRKLGSMLQYVKVMEKRNVDELIILDICATETNRGPLCKEISEYTSNLFCPCTIGGGIRSLDDIHLLLEHGADKVAIKTMALNLGFVSEASKKFGSQAIVAVVDVPSYETHPFVVTNCVVDHCKLLEEWGAGEILLTDTQREGTMNGYNINIIRAVTDAVHIPVIANGGCGEPIDMVKAIRAGASAVAAGSMFLYTQVTPKDCAEFLYNVGIPVRLHTQKQLKSKEEMLDYLIEIHNLTEEDRKTIKQRIDSMTVEELNQEFFG